MEEKIKLHIFNVHIENTACMYERRKIPTLNSDFKNKSISQDKEQFETQEKYQNEKDGREMSKLLIENSKSDEANRIICNVKQKAERIEEIVEDDEEWSAEIKSEIIEENQIEDEDEDLSDQINSDIIEVIQIEDDDNLSDQNFQTLTNENQKSQINEENGTEDDIDLSTVVIGTEIESNQGNESMRRSKKTIENQAKEDDDLLTLLIESQTRRKSNDKVLEIISNTASISKNVEISDIDKENQNAEHEVDLLKMSKSTVTNTEAVLGSEQHKNHNILKRKIDSNEDDLTNSSKKGRSDIKHFCIFCSSEYLTLEHVHRHETFNCKLNPASLKNRAITKNGGNKCALDPKDNEDNYEMVFQKKIPCQFCSGKKFATKEKARRHELISCEINPKSLKNRFKLVHGVYECPDCFKDYTSWELLNQHFDLVHANVPTKCPKCGVFYKSLESMKHHLTRGSCKDETKFSCQYCHFNQFLTKERVNKHELLHCEINPRSLKKRFILENGLYKCPECLKDYKNWDRLREHFTVVHDNLAKKCPKCGGFYKNSSALRSHLLKGPCKYDNGFSCQYCSLYNFSTKEKAEKHQLLFCEKNQKSVKNRSIVENGIYKCCDCLKEFKYWDPFLRHCRKFHSVEPAKCQKCNVIYRNLASLQSHLKNEYCNAQNEVSCQYCSLKKFISKEKAYRHELLLCEMNPKSLKNKFKLENGVYKCQECLREFNSWDLLLQHTDTVHVIGPTKCSKCEVVYKSLESMREHLEKKGSCKNDEFSCQYCTTRKFETKDKALRHERLFCKIHPKSIKNRYILKNGIYKCCDCLEEFKSWDQLFNHTDFAHVYVPS